ncbi:hypothetical protein LUX33_01100 [Actinomadura madurae]|uniref:hypothetical protein n=1 Tax=Actinomadura madurae TaxID=1993 RepID=UPI0020D22FF5|nr:hypothetical protein [Actinomadura madurae]MCP9947191.1 hypothetical protein [Actinomadura madurae]
MIVAFVLVLVLAAMVVVFLVLENRDLDKRLRGEQMRADAASDDAQRARSRARIAADQRSLAVTGYQDLLAEVRDLASQLEASHGELLARRAAPDRRRPARQVAEGWAVTWRAFLLTTVAAAAVAVLVTMQVRTRDITLTTSGVTTQEEGAYLGWARTEAPELWAADDALLLRVGLGLCESINRIPAPAVAPQPVGGLTTRELRAVTDAATRHLCPAQRGKVTGYLRGTR